MYLHDTRGFTEHSLNQLQIRNSMGCRINISVLETSYPVERDKPRTVGLGYTLYNVSSPLNLVKIENVRLVS